MSKNLKREYLIKLKNIATANGYKIDLMNYIYNPSHEHTYPTLRKLTSETETTVTYTEFLYFKYYDGTGEYIKKIFSAPKTDETWSIVNDIKETVLEKSPRFSLDKLLKLCETEIA